MTNHIEQLMKAAGVKPYKHTYFECKGGRSTISLCPQLGDPEKWCENECEEMQEKQEFLYPAFTPKKQLELIKLLFKAVPTKLNPYFEPVKNSDKWRYTHTDLTFEEALAEMIYNALPVLDKAEVKRILEDD